MNVEDEIYYLVQVRRDPVSGLYAIEYPNHRTVQAAFLALGIRAVPPDADDPIWRSIEQRVKANMPKLRAMADQLCPRFIGGANQEPPTMSTKSKVTTAHSADARVRSMTGAEALAECATLGIAITPHNTNPGITSMRAKNALYTYIRRNANTNTGEQRHAA